MNRSYDDDGFKSDNEVKTKGSAATVKSESVSSLSKEEGNWESIGFDEIEVAEQIGSGSVGLVHRGFYRGKTVAIKTLFNGRVDETMRRECLDELLVLSQLDHPNIVRLLGACMTPPHLLYVMELCHGSLFDLLHKSQRHIDTRRSLVIALDVSRAMAYLHSRHPPIIHRDLKSLNLLLASDDGSVKLCDFGLVRTAITTAGTPAYMAPELLQARPFSKSIDVYAFGILLWEIFSRDVPFSQYEPADVREAVLSGGRPEVPRGGYPREIEAMMHQCWGGEPSQRPNFVKVERVLEVLVKSTHQKSPFEGLEVVGGDCLDDLLGKSS